MASSGLKLQPKLEAKLDTLAETSSKESLQTIAKWIGFNRKHHDIFADTFKDRFKRGTPSNSVLVSLIHEVLLAERGTEKWDKSAELRETLGESVVLPCASQLDETAKGKLREFLPEWDKENVFGGPTLIGQIRRSIAELPAKESKPQAPVSTPIIETTPLSTVSAEIVTTHENNSAKPSSAKDSDDVKPPKVDEIVPVLAESSQATSSVDVLASNYDFESKGIPEEPVKIEDFMEPSTNVATLQIARDLRNDSAVQLSALLSALPEDIRAVCAEAAQTDGPEYKLTEAQARDFSVRIDESLLNMDLDEQLQNVQLLRDIIVRQRRAREQLVRMLIQSRCKFGADEAAEAFFKSESLKEELKKRRQVLLDTMDLEGHDVESERNKGDSPDEKGFEPLSWYAPDAKKQKTW